MVAADRIPGPDRRGRRRQGPAGHDLGAALHRQLPGHRRLRQRHRPSGTADLGGGTALLQPVPADLHHPFRNSDPQPIIRGCTGRGTAPRAATGSASRNRFPPIPLWTAKKDSISLPGQVGLPGIRHSIGLARWWHLGVDTAVAAQRRGVLRAAVHHRAVAARGPDQLVGDPQRGVGADPVSVAAVAGRERLGGLQQPAADRLLHHHLHRRPAGVCDRIGHVPGAVDPVQADQQAVQHPAGPLAALPGAGLVPVLHHHPRHAGVHHGSAAQPQPHLRRARRDGLGRVRGLRRLDGGGRGGLGGGHPIHAAPPARWCSGSASR